MDSTLIIRIFGNHSEDTEIYNIQNIYENCKDKYIVMDTQLIQASSNLANEKHEAQKIVRRRRKYEMKASMTMPLKREKK